jgi:AAA domain
MALAENVRCAIPVYWVYVYNFAQADRPHAIRLPQGRGRAFTADHRAEAGQDHDAIGQR